MRTTENQSTRRTTSDEAHRTVPFTIDQRMYEAIQRYPRTVDQLMHDHNLGHASVSAAVNRLMRAGRIVASGQRRMTRSYRMAIVWRIAEAGEAPVVPPTRRQLDRRIQAAVEAIDRNHSDLVHLRRILTGEVQP